MDGGLSEVCDDRTDGGLGGVQVNGELRPAGANKGSSGHRHHPGDAMLPNERAVRRVEVLDEDPIANRLHGEVMERELVVVDRDIGTATNDDSLGRSSPTVPPSGQMRR